MPASRRVTRAVSEVLDLAPRRGEVSLPRLVDAVSEDRERPIELKMADLPPGVCGQWRQYADRDVFLIQKGLPAWDRTLAHELGHLVLGHQGIPVVQAARENVDLASSDLIGYTEYLRSAGLSQVAALAVPGLGGMLVLTGAGGLVGYRQAKAGHAVHTSGTARFVN